MLLHFWASKLALGPFARLCLGCSNLVNAVVVMLSDASMRHKSIPPARPLHQQKSFWEASGSKSTLWVSWPAELREGKGHLPPWPWALPACGSDPAAVDAAGNVLPSPASRVHLRTPAGKVMTKRIDTQMLRQKFGAWAGNWYKWLQTSCEAERVLTMRHRDLRDSCRELSLSLPLAESANMVGQCLRSSHPFTPLPPSSISLASRSASAPRPSPPECCCGRSSTRVWSTVQKASVNYTTVISHQWTHSLTAYGRWTNTCRLSGAEREADLFPELATLISPSWSCKAECASVIWFFFQAQLCCSEVCHQKQWDFWRVYMGKAGRRVEGISAFHSTGSCLNSQKHELNFQISAIPCVHWQLVHQQRTAEPCKAGWKALGICIGVILTCTLKIKETVNCHVGAGQGSTQPCLQSWPSATPTVSGEWKETPQSQLHWSLE